MVFDNRAQPSICTFDKQSWNISEQILSDVSLIDLFELFRPVPWILRSKIFITALSRKDIWTDFQRAMEKSYQSDPQNNGYLLLCKNQNAWEKAEKVK